MSINLKFQTTSEASVTTYLGIGFFQTYERRKFCSPSHKELSFFPPQQLFCIIIIRYGHSSTDEKVKNEFRCFRFPYKSQIKTVYKLESSETFVNVRDELTTAM
jgi:hypothetical protein